MPIPPDSLDIPDDGRGNWFSRRPWLLVILLFVIVTMGLATMLTIAHRTFPGTVEPHKSSSPSPSSSSSSSPSSSPDPSEVPSQQDAAPSPPHD